MTVIAKQTEQRFLASEVLWAKSVLIEALVREALIGQTDAFVEMIKDHEPQDIGRDGINEILRGVPESAQEFLNDMIGDIGREVERKIKAAQYGASVTAIKYDLAGDITDIDVDVSVSFEGE